MAETVMIDPQGRECPAGTAAEVHNLLARGYRIKQPEQGQPRPASRVRPASTGDEA